MGKINVLSSKIYNRISAGEVVENPASIVKELVENCIDAGSTSITIEIENGGLKLIKVIDNGCGIDFDDLEKAFLPHATSKICCAEDLDDIETLGFRGEALASISAVAQVELFSKTKDEEIGGKICISGGEINSISKYSCVEGTCINIKNLFFNTPARLKFLKSNKREESLVTNIINKLMFANPKINFKYIIDGKIFYNSIMGGLKEKIFTVYGKSVFQNLVEVNRVSGKYKLSGFISSPDFCKSNKSYQTLIVNGRYVQNANVSVSVSNAYENFLMKGKFPFFILNLELPYIDLDVNVHPSKLEVKFKDNSSIYEFIYSSIFKILSEKNSSKAIFLEQKNNSIFENKNNFFDAEKNSKLDNLKNGYSFSDLELIKDEIRKININPIEKQDDDMICLNSDFTNDLFDYNTISNNYSKEDSSINEESDNNEINFLQSNQFESIKPIVNQQRFDSLDFDYKILGRLFNTYLLIEFENNFYLIDQHAGHERVIFDRLFEEYNEKKIIKQPLLIPFNFEVNSLEKNLIEDNIDVLFDLGFEIKKINDSSYSIITIPYMLSGLNLQSFISDALKDLEKISSTNNEIKNHFAQAACKNAVKAGYNLSEEEISSLLTQIYKNNTILLCPHGRPIFVKFSKYEIEKMFKRIV